MSNYQNGFMKLVNVLGLTWGSDGGKWTELDVDNACGVAADKIVEFQKCHLCKLLSMNASEPVEVILNQGKVIDDLDESREWDGVEPLFVGAIVEGGTVAAIGARVCIRDDLDGLHVVRTIDVKPVKDAAVRIIDAAYGDDLSDSQRNIRIGVLRNLAQQGLITFND